MTIFSNNPYDRRMERLMMTVPNFAPRVVGFRFTEGIHHNNRCHTRRNTDSHHEADTLSALPQTIQRTYLCGVSERIIDGQRCRYVLGIRNALRTQNNNPVVGIQRQCLDCDTVASTFCTSHS